MQKVSRGGNGDATVERSPPLAVYPLLHTLLPGALLGNAGLSQIHSRKHCVIPLVHGNKVLVFNVLNLRESHRKGKVHCLEGHQLTPGLIVRMNKNGSVGTHFLLANRKDSHSSVSSNSIKT